MNTEKPGTLLPLQLCNVRFTLGSSSIIADASVRISDHGISVLLGHNGAGKSILLKLLHGLEKPTSGLIKWGTDQLATEQVRHRQAMVFQKPVLLRRSVAANLKYVLDLPHTQSPLTCTELLELAELTSLATQPARSLSGGEQQRLAFARALACGPQVLFLDEPTANLDPDATLRLERLISRASDCAIKVFLVTHDLSQAKRLASDIIFLRSGSIEEHTTAEAFFTKPQSPYCQSFVDGVLTTTSLQQ